MLDKKSLRTIIKNINFKYKDYNFDEEDKIIINKLIKTEMYQRAKTILLYYPLKNEVNVIELINYSLKKEKKVALPITNKNNIEFFSINKDWENNLILGKYNIWEPKKSEVINDFNYNSLIIVPALAYGKDNSRIGHGCGYYDKYLQEHTSLTKIGLARHHLLFDRILMQSNDIYLDYIISSK